MKSRKFRFAALALSAVMILAALAGCGSNSGSTDENVAEGGDQPAVTLKAGMAGNKDDYYYAGLEKFKEVAEENSNGSITVEIYTDGTLGDERDLIEGCQMGSVDLCATANGPVGGFVEKSGVFNLPFLFRDMDHMRAVLSSDVVDPIKEEYEAVGLKNMGYYEVGFRSVINNKKPVNSLADAKGIKIRTLENDIMVDAYKELGFEVTTMPMSEVITSLQNGTIDGADNPLMLDVTAGYYELCKYLTLSEVILPVGPITMSKQTYDSLTPEQQAVVEDAIAQSIEYQREVNDKNNEGALDTLKEKGVEVVELQDREAWEEAVQPVYDKYTDTFGADLIQKIKDM